MGNKNKKIIPAHYSWNSSIITRGVIDPIKRKLGWVDENERPVSLKESATGQELDRMKETAKNTGKLVVTGLAFGNPVIASSAMAPLITSSKAYFMSGGLKDAYDRVTSPNKTAADGAMVALDVAGAVPAVGAAVNGAKYILPTAAKTVAPALIVKQISKTKLPTVEPTLNIGWGPKQTINVSRAGEYNQMYFPERWDVVNEGANPHGVWLQGKYGIPRTEATNPGKGMKAAKARNIFSTRPDKYTGTVILDKPMITVGEVPNRSLLSYQADNMGADGLIYNGVYDNGYNNNQIILSFKKPKLNRVKFSLNSPDIRYKQGGILKRVEKAQTGTKFEDWYKTVPKEKNDTTTYNLRRAFELAPKDQLDAFVKDPNAHLYSAYLNKDTGEYEFMKRKDHPTIQDELDWYNSNYPEAIKFRKKYKLDTSGDYYKYIPIGKSGIRIKPENRGKLTRLKRRTGKSEAELWKEGSPAVRKMITFARNARKWKHK